MNHKTNNHYDRQAILAAVDDYRDQIIQLLQEFIRIPTVNPPGEAYEDFVVFMGEHSRSLVTR